MADELISKRVANALVKDAEINPAIPWLGSAMTLKLFRHIWGGLWVGGEVFLYRDKILFRPNAPNLAAHRAGTIGVIEIPLSIITAVTQKRGVVTGIVQVTFGRKQFVFRCYGSKLFAQEILDATAESQIKP